MRNAKADIKENFKKLLSTAWFVKTKETSRNRSQTRFSSTPIEAKVCTLKHNFLKFQNFQDTLVYVHLTEFLFFEASAHLSEQQYWIYRK